MSGIGDRVMRHDVRKESTNEHSLLADARGDSAKLEETITTARNLGNTARNIVKLQ